MTRSFTPSQVLSHNKEDDLYLVISNKVYDASEFAKEHPGGKELLLDLAGQDATGAYLDAGHSEEADEILSDILVGHLEPVVMSVAEKSQSEEPLKTTNIVVKIQETISSLICPSAEISRAFLVPDKFQETELVEKTVISHNVAIYRFKLPAPDSILGLPTGQHVSIEALLPQDDGTSKEIVRSYTPISNDQEPGSFQLLIKAYPSGNISKHVGCLSIGDQIRVRGPKGAFKYTPNMVRHFGMVAGGTGITPMLQIVEAVLRGRPDGDETEIDLIYANVSAEDILLKQRLDALAKVVSGFRIHYVLDKPPEGWTGGVGYVTGDMVSKWLPKPAKDVKILLCGPPPMISGLKKSTEALGFEKASPVSKLEDQIFAF